MKYPRGNKESYGNQISKNTKKAKEKKKKRSIGIKSATFQKKKQN